MSRILPYPLLSAGLLLMWLILNRFSLGHLVLGGAISVVAGRAMSALEPEKPRIRRWSAIPRLFGWVCLDVLQSNLAVARLVLLGRSPGSRPGFIEIPLELRDPTALAILSVILTATPGTAWMNHDTARRTVLIHVLDLEGAEAWSEIVKNRYERLLREIFE